MKTSGRATTRAPLDAAARTQCLASSKFAALSLEASICTAAAKNFIASFPDALPIQENRAGAFSQHVFGGAAYNHFDDAPVPIGADEQEVVVELCQIIDDLLLRIATVNLIAGFDGVGAQIGLGLLQYIVCHLLFFGDGEHGQGEAQHRTKFSRRFHGRTRSLTAIICKHWSLDSFELLRRDKDRAGTLPHYAFCSCAEKAGGKLFVDSTMANNDEIGNFGALADFVGNQAHVQESLMFDPPITASLGKIFQDHFAALLQDFTHLRGKVEVRFESERAGNIVKKSALD